jgi:D-alanyl-D-alanine carboxypeptidase (penicillin-binding protein 5/6)
MQDQAKEFFSQDNRRLLNLGLLLILVLSLVLLVSLYTHRSIRIVDEEPIVQVDPFQNINVIAKAAIVYEIGTGRIIFQKNANMPLPLASLAKVMTAVTATRLLPSDAVITIERSFINEEGDSGLLADEKWGIAELLNFSLTVSSNDGIAAVAGAVGSLGYGADSPPINENNFIEEMNELSREIGMDYSLFFNETGLDIDAGRSGAYGSAHDMAMLFGYAVRNHPQIFDATRDVKGVFTSLDEIDHTGVNTNEGVSRIPGLIASKTGFTELAGGNLGIVMDTGLVRPIAIVVLGSTSSGRFQDVELLSLKTFEYIAQGR